MLDYTKFKSFVLQMLPSRKWRTTWGEIGRKYLQIIYLIREVSRRHKELFSSVQSLSRVWFFETPWIAARQASLSITNSQSLPKLTSIKSVMPSNHLILCHPLLLPPSIFPSIRSFQMSQLFSSGGQSIWVSASISVLPMSTNLL